MKKFTSLFYIVLLFAFLSAEDISYTQSKIYWTEQISLPKIKRANIDGSNVEDIVSTGLARPSGIEVDMTNGKIYWSDISLNKILKADLDGSNVEDVISGISNPIEIALDISGGKVYWSSGFTVHRADLDGNNEETIADMGNSNPNGIDLDLTNGKVYWTLTGGSQRIYRSDLDGNNREFIISSGIDNAKGITLDVANGKMYWVESGNDPVIRRANLDGNNVETLVSNNPTPVLQTPYGIALDLTEGKIYWADFGMEKIMSANLDGSDVQEVISSGLHEPSYVSLYLIPTAIDDEITSVPNKYVLHQNYPNPFNPSTTIKFSIPTEEFTTLTIYDILGNQISELVSDVLPAGNHKYFFNAESLTSGVYFYKIKAGEFFDTKKMMVLK